MLWIEANNLKNWASTRDCQGYLPLVIRRLVRATAKEISQISFSAGDSIVYPGWDGILKASSGTEYIPDGISVWEIGSNENIKKKAEDDYKKRKENSLGINPKETTWIFITPRIWPEKDEWCRDKIAEGFWKDVRTYDARTLEEWLEQAPAVSAWLARYLGIYPKDVKALEDWWDGWSGITNPRLTSKLVLAGRSKEVESIQQWLSSPLLPITVQAATSEEALAFLAAVINSLPENDREFYLSKSLVVESSEAFNRTMVTGRANLLLIPTFEEIESSTLAAQKGHLVYVPLPPDSKAMVTLPRLGRDEFILALKEMGLSEEDSQKYSRDTGRSLTVFRRRLTNISKQPVWAKVSSARDIIPALLVGSWIELKMSDKGIIAQLANESYESFSQKLCLWQHKSDPPILKIGEIWRLESPLDAWFLLAYLLSDGDLRQFKSVVLNVLVTKNPVLDLEPEKRWMASVYGKEQLYSKTLREGIAQTLVLMAVFGDEAKLTISTTSQTWVDSVVREIFQNADWKLWHSLSDVLPLIAEASPPSFLDAVEFSLAQDNSPVLGMFSETEDTLSSSSAHPSLLWALEGLAWSPQLLGRVTLILGKLTSLDPGGKISNRPINSLRTIFLLWRPHTYASLEKRLEAIDVLIEREPEVGWRLLVNLMPRRLDHCSSTHKPRWRQFFDKTEIVTTVAEHSAAIKVLIDRMLLHLDNNGQRWVDVLESFSALPEEEKHKIIEHLSSSVSTISVGRLELHDRLRKLLSWHRSFSDTGRTLPNQELKEIENIYVSLEPKDVVERYRWLFDSHWPDLPEGEKNDLKKAEQIVEQRRIEAVKTIKNERSFDGLIKLAEQTTNPWVLGFVVAEVGLTSDEEDKLFPLLEDGSKNKIIFAQGYTFRRSIKDGDEWVYSVIKVAQVQKWTELKTVNFFVALPQKKSIWDLLESFDEGVKKSYWGKIDIQVFHTPIEDKIYAIKQLLRAKRYFTAIHAVTLFVKDIPPRLILEMLQKAAIEKSEENFRLNAYNIESLFNAIDKSDEISENELVQIEWLYLTVLAGAGSGREPKTLHKALSNNPNFFAEVIKYIYKSKKENRKSDEESLPAQLIEQRAHLAWQLLESWKTVPESDDNGVIEYKKLKAWVDKAREACKKLDREEAGDTHIGQVFAYAKPEKGNIWPPEAVCKIIDEIQSSHMSDGFRVAIYNKRGFVTKSPSDGGQQEKKLAEEYKRYADNWAVRYPHTASILMKIAAGYENDAKREDKEAERRDLEY